MSVGAVHTSQDDGSVAIMISIVDKALLLSILSSIRGIRYSMVGIDSLGAYSV